jgi:hypothetical protein
VLRQTAASPAAIPFSIRWHNPARGVSIDFHFRTIRRLHDLVNGMDGPGIGVMLGSVGTGTADTAILDVCVVGNGDQVLHLPLSDTLAQAISAYASGPQHRMYPVGLFLVGDKGLVLPAGSQLARVAHVFKGIVPLFIIERQPSGAPVVRLNLWLPALGVVEKGNLEFPLDWRLLAQQNYHPFIANYQGGHTPMRPAPAAPEPAPSLPPPEWNAIVTQPQAYVQPAARPVSADTSVLRIPKWVAGSVAAGALTAAAMWVVMRQQSDLTRYIQPGLAKETPSASSDLGLEVSRTGADLQVKWNRSSSEVLSAQYGVLRVLEDGNRLEVPLNAEQLRSGRILYSPRAATLDLILDITTGNGKAQETVRVIQSPGVSTGQPAGWEPGAALWRRNPDTSSAGHETSSRSLGAESAPSRESGADALEKQRATKIFALPPAPAAQKPVPSVDVAPPVISHVAQSAPVVPAARKQELTGVPPPPTSLPSQPAANSAPERRGVLIPPVLRSNVNVGITPQTKSLLRGPVELELRINVNERGRVTRVDPVHGAGLNAYIAHYVAQHARYWRFDPATLDGKPVAADHVIKLTLK